MSTIAVPRSSFIPPRSAMSAGDGGVPRRFSVEEYHRLISAGVLNEDDAVELLEGAIIYKMPRNSPHDGTVGKVDLALRRHIPPGWTPRIQCAMTTSDSEPEPDFALARGAPDDYMQRHPGPGDVRLVVEVASSSLELDRRQKGAIYARAGVRVYWIVNLIDASVEVYTDPSGPAELPSYRQQKTYKPDESVPLELPGSIAIKIAVSELLPTAPK